MSPLPLYLAELLEQLRWRKSARVACKIVGEYCSFFGKRGWDDDFQFLVAAALSSDEMEELETGAGRYDMIFFVEYTKMVLEAVSVLWGVASGELRVGSGRRYVCRRDGVVVVYEGEVYR